jgi:predicted outer membrane lipoprotein
MWMLATPFLIIAAIALLHAERRSKLTAIERVAEDEYAEQERHLW